MAEQYLGYREGNRHRAQLNQYPVPLINNNPLLSGGYDGEDLTEAVLPM